MKSQIPVMFQSPPTSRLCHNPVTFKSNLTIAFVKLPVLPAAGPHRCPPRNMKVKVDAGLCWTHKRETTWASGEAPQLAV